MSKIVVVEELVDTLPFKDALDWDQFQRFCTDIIHRLNNSVDTREYLTQGSGQEGIDIYSVKKGNEKLIVAQCKLKKYIGPQATLDIIDDFLKGDLVNDTQEFILCTSADLGRQRDEDETISKARLKLAEKNINLKVWDERGLSRELRTNATHSIIAIVARYFDEAIALKFYGDLWIDYLKIIRKITKFKYDIKQDYIERTISSFQGKFDIYQ
jgi:Restriction endonuclease